LSKVLFGGQLGLYPIMADYFCSVIMLIVDVAAIPMLILNAGRIIDARVPCCGKVFLI
jgi:hypothetical protein